MNPIDPIGPADTAVKTARLTLESASPEGPSVEALTQRFQAMMQGPHHAGTVQGAEGPNVVSEVLTRGEDMLQQHQHELLKLKEDAPHLTPAELSLRTTEVASKMSAGSFRMEAAMAIASSSNKSVQSLLKNQ